MMPRMRKIKFMRQCERPYLKGLKSMSSNLINQMQEYAKERAKMEEICADNEDSEESNSVQGSSGSSDFVIGNEDDDIFAEEEKKNQEEEKKQEVVDELAYLDDFDLNLDDDRPNLLSGIESMPTCENL